MLRDGLAKPERWPLVRCDALARLERGPLTCCDVIARLERRPLTGHESKSWLVLPAEPAALSTETLGSHVTRLA